MMIKVAVVVARERNFVLGQICRACNEIYFTCVLDIVCVKEREIKLEEKFSHINFYEAF